MARYVQCLVCGRLTPDDRGTCYHCKSPLPTRLDLPEGLVVCPSCLRITPVDTGYCKHCKSPLPPSLIIVARKQVEHYKKFLLNSHEDNTVKSLPIPHYYRTGFGGFLAENSQPQEEPHGQEEKNGITDNDSERVQLEPKVFPVIVGPEGPNTRRILIPKVVGGGGRV